MLCVVNVKRERKEEGEDKNNGLKGEEREIEGRYGMDGELRSD